MALNPKVKKAIITAIKIVILIVAVYLLLHFKLLDFSALKSVTDRPLELALGFFSMLLFYVSVVYRWDVLLKMQGVKLGGYELWRIMLASFFFNVVLPGGGGGDAARVVYIKRHFPERFEVGVFTVFLDRLFGFYGLVVIGFVAGLILTVAEGATVNNLFLLGANAAIFAFATGAVLFMFYTKRREYKTRFALLNRILNNLTGAGAACGRDIKGLWNVLILAVLSGGFTVGGIYFFMLALHETLGLVFVSTVTPLVSIANMLPLSPGGIGVGEGVTGMLFAGAGSSLGEETMLLLRVALTVAGLIGAVGFL
ncbi:MAG: flippase-like domain-containing protein, partial [bacterium]|nr:flippase-like domain-containing protein [bacterium]